MPVVIEPKLTPPRDPLTGELAKPTGETYRNHIVYSMSMVDFEATKHPDNRKPVLGPDGKPVVRKNPDGESWPVYHRPTVFKRTEFILESSPQGEVRIVTNFRATDDDIAVQRRGEMVREFQANLAQAAVERGMTAEQLVERLLAAKGEQEPVPEAAALAKGNVEVVAGGPGWFNVFVDGKQVGKNMRRPAAEELADSFRGAGVGADAGDTSY